MKIEANNLGAQLSEQLTISKNKLEGSNDFLDLIMCLFDANIAEMPAACEETKLPVEQQIIDGQPGEDCIGYQQYLYQPYVNSDILIPINLQSLPKDDLSVAPLNVSLQHEINGQLNLNSTIEPDANQTLPQDKNIKEFMPEAIQESGSEEELPLSHKGITADNKSNSFAESNIKSPVIIAGAGFNQDEETQPVETVKVTDQEKTKFFDNQLNNQPTKMHTQNDYGLHDQSKSFSQNPELNNGSTINQTFTVASGGNQNNIAPPANTLSHQEPIPMQLAPVIQRAVLQSSSHQTTLKLKLKPDHLGELTIQLVYSKGSLNAQFITADHMAKEAVEGSFPMLKEILAQNNIKLDEAFAFVGNQSGDRPNEHGQGSYYNSPFYKQSKNKTHQMTMVSNEQRHGNTEDPGLDRLI